MVRARLLVVSLGALVATTACKANKDTEAPQGSVSSGVKQIAVGEGFTVALFNDGYVRMVGSPFASEDADVREIRFGGKVVEVAAGRHHLCALLDTGAVRCMGHNAWGALGYGHTESVTDPSAEGDVDLGGKAVGITAGHGYSCARLDGGTVRCWGTAQGGRLGYGNRDDARVPAVSGDVPVGAAVRVIEAGALGTTCAVLETGTVRCWGQSLQGALGYGSPEDVGALNTPESVGDVQLPSKVVDVTVGGAHVCALLEGGKVRCWGFGAEGRLGYPAEQNVGDDETPMQGSDANVGGPVSEIAAGLNHTCALLESGSVRCWGMGREGQLGYGDVSAVGEVLSPAQAGDLELGGAAKQVVSSPSHSCALLESGDVMCWGAEAGQKPSNTPSKLSL